MMMKQMFSILIPVLLGVGFCFTACNKSVHPLDKPSAGKLSNTLSNVAAQSVAANPNYQLIWADEFNATGSFDNNSWSYCPRNGASWGTYLTSTPDYAYLDGQNLVVKMDNAVIPGDNVPYHSGGIQSMNKVNFRYGKLEVRAKMKEGQGSWPAIWLMPEPAFQYAGWPGCGEIDLMEHVNFANSVKHRTHRLNGNLPNVSSQYVKNDYNLYTLEWTPDDVKMFVNGAHRFTYSRVAGGGWQQWPFDVPFYIILNQSGGVGWPGPITNSHLPFYMYVDYVRLYKLSVATNGGFESGSLSPWDAWPSSGSTAGVVSNNAHSGTHAVRLQGGEASVEQTITGLTPNTTYIVGAYAKLANTGGGVCVGVKNYGGSTIDNTVTNVAYEMKQVTFTTGATNTSATIYFYKNGVSNTAYADDFYLEKQ
ncbi:family 16 glycosylhydrolase [Chitinophaga rhizosphaerae]|uniref:family 16 glycosylhydrolase n=1 Tax=Chitinophaga rhizosphaerae TaxID=1864947 RepID=UPI000F80562D|nr:family 16 glycosylhydrolase [Chitinophaga rhizosphaerae]